MTRFLAASALTLSLLAAGTAAQAQSYTAPAGIPAAAAPGNALTVGAGSAWSGSAPSTYDSATTGSVARSHHGRALRR